MKRLVVMVVAAGAAMMASAMPTKAELQKAQAMVNDVTAADVMALRKKEKTPADVAARHMELAGQAGNEAEKYILLQGAFKLYAKAGDYDGAANALGTMNREISNMSPEVIVEIYNNAIFSSMKEKAPKLYAIKESARRQVFYRKQLAKALSMVKANPKDPTAQKKLGECYAELGDWSKALDAFALAGGNLAKTAAAEKAGTAAPQASGDFWWDYESGDEMSTYKLHAAELYRAALADDSFKGLVRTRTEQRVKEADAVAADLPQMGMVATSAVVVSGMAPMPNCKMVDGRPAPMKFALAKGVDLELEGCPAGKFTMGYAAGMWNKDGKAAPKHEVTITRPFWIGKFQVTRRQAKSLEVSPSDCYLEVQSAFDEKGGDTCSAIMSLDNMNAFCRKLTEKFAEEIPSGYVFRLASNAEWEYASKAGNYSEKNPAMLYAGHSESPYILTRHDKLALLKKKNIEWKGSPCLLPAFPGGLKKPNRWGIFDMLGNHPEVTMDRIPKKAPDVVNYGQGGESGIIQAITYGKQDTDPLLYCESDWNLLVRGRWDNYLLMEGLRAERIQWTGGHGYAFRVCLGPDLVAEKRTKSSETTAAARSHPVGKKFSLAPGIDLAMIGCPAGEFTMGFDVGVDKQFAGAVRKHKVVITRPFYVGRDFVSVAQWDALMPKKDFRGKKAGDEAQIQRANFSDCEKFCRVLNERFKSARPSGYVFRLQTEAEFEYGLKSGGDVLDLPVSFGTEPTTAWGIKYSTENSGVLLDVIGCDAQRETWSRNCQGLQNKYEWVRIQSADYAAVETDPLVFDCAKNEPRSIEVAFQKGDVKKAAVNKDRVMCFRVCLGPDLVAEKRAKK